MGNILKLIGFGLAIVGIGVSLLLPWWHTDLMGAGSLDISLRTAELCSGGSCTSAPTGGMYGIVAMMTLVYGVIAVAMIALGGFLPALRGDDTRPMAAIGGVVYLVLVGLTYGALSLPDELAMLFDIHTTVWFKAGIAGAALAMFAPMLGWLEPKAKPAPYRPADARPGRTSSLPPVADRPRTPSRAPLAPIAIELDGAMDTPAPAPAPGVAPSVLPTARLRFAIASADIKEESVTALLADGSSRMVRWSELGGALARELGAPHATLLVDLVPSGAPPLRFHLGSRLTFSSGNKDGDPRDALRRLLAFARAMHPEIELEAATTDFLYKRTDLPTWSADELERYDARYAR